MVQQFHCSSVALYEQVGQGAFGKVSKGLLNGTDVAVKIMRGNNWDAKDEIERMKGLDHEHVLKLLGTVPPHMHTYRCGCRNTHITWIIMEYMAKGSLKDYVLNYPGGGLPANGMIHIAYQVAVGMDYLHRVARIVHRDLAARNVLVKDDSFNVKIGDFGLSSDYDYNETYYQDEQGRAFPVRWMPPENMPGPDGTARFSRKGDVWSYGVLLFEIWSRMVTPFDGMDTMQVVDVVSCGETVLNYYDLKARKWVRDLMEECFQFEKDDRPNFRHIYETIFEEEYE